MAADYEENGDDGGQTMVAEQEQEHDVEVRGVWHAGLGTAGLQARGRRSRRPCCWQQAAGGPLAGVKGLEPGTLSRRPWTTGATLEMAAT